MANKDYYDILGVARDADNDTIKKAYRKLAMKYHPDRNTDGPDAEEKFKEIGKAYAALSDENQRAKYDRFGEAGLGGGAGGYQGMEVDPFEIFRSFMGGFGFDDIFGGGGGGGGGGRSRTHKGRDIQINLKLTLEEIAEGVNKKIRVSKYKNCDSCDGDGSEPGSSPRQCPTCKGRGEVRQVTRTILGQMVNIQACQTCGGLGTQITDPCKVCDGEGRSRGDGEVEIEIPAGVSEGNYLTVQGEGHAAGRGGIPGDLIVVFEEKKHDFFERSGDDIYFDLNVSIPEAVLGVTVEVPTLGGKARLDIQAGVQPNSVLRLRGKGIQHLKGRGRGDQMVRIHVWIPKQISEDDRKLFDQLADSEALVPPVGDHDKSFFRKIKNTLFGH